MTSIAQLIGSMKSRRIFVVLDTRVSDDKNCF
jgi:hypothetical protein